MKIESRQEEILNLLRLHGTVEVDGLSRHFGLTTQTIRQDLRELGARGLLRRTHGGAQRLAAVGTRDYADRRKVRGAEKRAIARATAALIPDGSSVTLNIGTTTEQVAQALLGHSDLMVMSNNINIINQLSGGRTRDLVMVGGSVRQSDGAVVGEDAVEFISRYKVDYAVIGASALDPDGDVLDFDPQEVSVARAILHNSRTRILVADRAKFDVNAPVRICEISEIDYFVTDCTPPDGFVRAAEAGGAEILIAEAKA
ncbi:MAG: DeoR/GlpR family DNA-binding transcription regulator [Marinibacterium sp.]